VCIALCTIVAHNIAQNRPDSFPLTLQTITIAPMMSILRATLENSSGKNYQNRLMKVKVIARQSSDIFETQAYFFQKQNTQDT